MEHAKPYGLYSMLPVTIANLNIRKLSWSDFPGKASESEQFNAHIYWNVQYAFEQKDSSNLKCKKMRSLNIFTEVSVHPKSWVKKQSERLLRHESGHYIIGCLCALEFQKKCYKHKFSSSPSNEVALLFSQILNEFCLTEERYDAETNHGLDLSKQEIWNDWMLLKLRQAKQFFEEIQMRKKDK